MRRAVRALACMVVFVTTYSLILPALTKTKETYCGMEEHAHVAECYETYLVCGKEEYEGHKHSDACWDHVSNLACSREEHAHGDSCYDENGELTCGNDEHKHGDKCYESEKILV